MTSRVQQHEICLELPDDGAEFSRVLGRIGDAEPGFLSVVVRDSNPSTDRTPVELELECTHEDFASIVEGLERLGVSITETLSEPHVERFVVLLTGPRLEEGLDDTVAEAKRQCRDDGITLSVTDVKLSRGTDCSAVPAARLRLVTDAGAPGEALSFLRQAVSNRQICLIEPYESSTSGR